MAYNPTAISIIYNSETEEISNYIYTEYGVEYAYLRDNNLPINSILVEKINNIIGFYISNKPLNNVWESTKYEDIPNKLKLHLALLDWKLT